MGVNQMKQVFAKNLLGKFRCGGGVGVKWQLKKNFKTCVTRVKRVSERQ